MRRVLRDGHPALAAALGEARPVGIAGAVVDALAPPARLPAIEAAAAQHAIMAACLAVYGAPLQLAVRPGEVAASGDDRSRRWRGALDHPLVKDILRRFEAEPLSRELIGADDWRARWQAEQAADAAPGGGR